MEKITNYYVYGWIKKAYTVVILGVLILVGLTIFLHNDLRGVESNVIYSVQLALEDNGSLYTNPEKPPFNITQYSPLYYIINDGLISLIPIAPNNYFQIQVITRIVSILLLLLSLFVLVGTLQNVLRIKRSSSIIIGMTYLIISFPWFNISRPDVMLLLFFTLSVRSIFLFLKNNNLNTAFFLGVFMALGMMSKLTMGIYIVAFGLYMIIAKQWKLLFLSAISFVLTLFLTCAFIHSLGYDLTYLYQNTIEGINNGTSMMATWKKAYRNYFLSFGLFSLVFLSFSITYLKNWKNVRRNNNLIFLIIISYSIATFSFLSALKIGSAINYFNELLLCLLVFMVAFLECYHLAKKKLYLIGFMLFGMSIAINHTFLYAPRLLLNLKSLTSNHKSEAGNHKIKAFLESNLGDSYFYSQDRSIAQSFPQRCILFPTDIHDITFNREVFNYSFFKEWAKQNLRFIVVLNKKTELYGLDIEKYYSLKIRYQNYYLYELTSYNKK